MFFGFGLSSLDLAANGVGIFWMVDCISAVPLLRITRKVEVRRPFRLELAHLERVHVLYKACDLQRATWIFSKVEEQNNLLGEWAEWEGEGDVCLLWQCG